MSLPLQIQKIVDDANIACLVLESVGPHCLEVAHAMSMGYGIISNCNFTSDGSGAKISIKEDADGRAIVRVCKS